jgi:phosphoserine phosphatase
MKYKLVCFDVDGTLVDNVEYSWQLFHDYFRTDVKKREQAKTRFFNGEISYKEWAEHDINLWLQKGAKKEDFFKAMKDSEIKLMAGTKETLQELKKKGLKLAIISGSINIILEYLLPDYEEIFDDVFLSRLFFDKKGKITNVEATEYDMDGKALALKKIAERENLELNECVFVGDHRNDRKIAKEAGISIAFDAKDEELKKISDISIDSKDLRDILKHIL